MLNYKDSAGRGLEALHLDVAPKEKIKALEVLHNRFYQSITEGYGIQCYARGMSYHTRLAYERSNGSLHGNRSIVRT